MRPAIEVIVPEGATRGWHRQVVSSLQGAGYRVGVRPAAVPASSALLDLILRFERRFLLLPSSPLLARMPLATGPLDQSPDLRIDLTGTETVGGPPLLGVAFAGGQALGRPAAAIAAGRLPDVTVTLDNKVFDVARPMLDNRVVIGRGLEDLLARTVSLVLASCRRVLLGRSTAAHLPGRDAPPASGDTGIAASLGGYFGKTFPQLVGRIGRRLRGRSHAHWRVGYRFIDGPGVAETSDLSGPSWTVLPDDGSRFYADPFPWSFEGRHFIFVEDYRHKTRKGVISVAEIAPDGTATPPVPVIEEDYHLSYPEVFSHDGQLWMLPEASKSGSLVLYRAVAFPHRWTRHAVLIEGRELSDATLFAHQGRLWLIATERDGAGSTSDMMVVFFADRLEGPWTPHGDNPILIDRARARPGGAIVQSGGRLLLPVQDGTRSYGGGIGISQITELTVDTVALSAPTAVKGEGFWPYPAIHTVNRSGRLEVIDGISSF